MNRQPFLFLKAALLLVSLSFSLVGADPLDTVYWKTFYINTIGVARVATNYLAEYRGSMLTNTAGIMPQNVKVGFSAASPKIGRAADGYYDYLPSVFTYDVSLEAGRAFDMTIGTHLNALPWEDYADQSLDILHNYLEKYEDGALLQCDANGNFRSPGEQDPTLDEETANGFDFLEMQLSLSPYAPLVQDYILRNTRMAARYFAWMREESPDIVTFCTLTSETGLSPYPAGFCDYSEWSKQEFRDWLSGLGLYDGAAQYGSVSELNSTFGLSYNSWNDVEPPTTVSWSSSWWLKWHEFRVAQVQHFEQAQMSAAREAGWSPDRLFGHQQPGVPGDTTDGLYTRRAAPWSTTFVNEGGNGLTTYKENASDTNVFAAMAANDKNWGLVEYNPKTNGVALNLNALETVWNAKPHLICPYHWSLDYSIRGTDFETALSQFIGSHSNDDYSGMAEYETAPESRDVLWTMSYSSDIESSSGWSSLNISTGICYGTFSQTNASLSLELDESRHTLVSDPYYAMSTRMFFEDAPTEDIVFQWTDTNHITSSTSVPVQQGWNLCRVNLADCSAWREKSIKSFQLLINGEPGSEFRIDWLQLEAGPCWHFDDPGEVTKASWFSEWSVTNGVFCGTGATADHFFYLATDADRRFIDAEFYKRIRIRMTSSTNGNAQVYWWKEDVGYCATGFPITVGTHTYELNMSSLSNWSGLISTFRLDPVNKAGATCSIDYIALSPLILPPRPPVYDTIVNSPNPVFTWTPGTEPDNPSLTYEFQMATDFDFTNKVVNITGLTNTYKVYAGKELDGFYWWRVRARQFSGIVSPWMTPIPIFIRPWHFETTEDCTNIHGLETETVSNGIWTATTGFDPYFVLDSGFNNFTSPGINADIYSELQFRIRLDAPTTSSNAMAYFYTQEGTIPWVRFSLPPDNEWHTITVDLSANTNWTGYIKNVRLDPGNTSNATVSVDWVRLMPESDGDLDDDGIADEIEGSGDLDDDGLENYRDLDSDGDSMSDADEISAERDPYDASDMAFHFNTDGDFEGWTQWKNITGITVSNGLLSGRSTTSDPVVFTTNYTVNSDQIETIYVKLASGTNRNAVFYWKSNGQFQWMASTYTNYPDFQICPFRVGTDSNWNGIIEYLRVDPFIASNVSFSIDWILASDGDLDNDGVPDEADGFICSGNSELENFRNPDASSSPLLIEEMALSVNGKPQMQMNGYNGCTYIMKRTESLIDPDWTTVQTFGPLSSNQTMLFEDSTPPTSNAFYRIFSY